MTNVGSPVTPPRHASHRRLAASLAAGAAVAALILAGATAPAASATPRPAAHQPHSSTQATGAAWAIQPTPNPLVRDSLLTAVSCTSPSFCIAVGARRDRAGAQVTLAEVWKGTRWSVQQTPNPPGVPSSTLVGVSCTSATFCVAVGQTFTGTGSPPLAEIWNGTTWSVQQTPSVPFAGFNGVSCTSPSACTLVGTTGSDALAERWNGTSWSVQSTAPGLSTGAFSGVSCTSATACTAVGNRGFALPLAEAWNGTAWSVQPTPDPRSGGQLSGVSCTSASACTAVGHTRGIPPLAERWNGTTWSIQAAPSVRGLPTALESVSCTSASSCTATGAYNPSAITAPAAEAWNGTTWSVQQVPDPRPQLNGNLTGVSCTTASACTAAGYDVIALAVAWNGTSWSVQPIPTPQGTANGELSAVSCASATACLAVGDYRSPLSSSVPLAEMWNGTSWSLGKAPVNPRMQAVLNSVSCFAHSACTAVGYYANTVGGFSTLAESWNGTSWSVQQTPDQPGATESVLSHVSCTSASACTAVGYFRVPLTFGRSTLAENWNGTSWSVQQTPLRHTTADHVLDGVSCISASACTAVGHVGGDTLAEAWNGTSWSVQQTPHPDHGPNALFGVSCTSPSSCTAVGASYDGFLAETWNGTTWSIQQAPSPQGFDVGRAGSVSCTSVSACTAVVSSFYRTVTESWNGTSWSLEYPPAPAGVHRLLHDVSCVTPGGCTAVGGYGFTLADAKP